MRVSLLKVMLWPRLVSGSGTAFEVVLLLNASSLTRLALSLFIQKSRLNAVVVVVCLMLLCRCLSLILDT